jgi:hypothetical protein
VQGIGEALFGMTIEDNPFPKTFDQFLVEKIPQLTHLTLVAWQIRLGNRTCCPQPYR